MVDGGDAQPLVAAADGTDGASAGSDVVLMIEPAETSGTPSAPSTATAAASAAFASPAAPAAVSTAMPPPPVLVPRDYTQGEQCRFATAFPVALTGKVNPDDFQATLATVNQHFAEAERLGYENTLESVLGCATCFLSYAFLTTHYERCMQRLMRFIEAENVRVYMPAGFVMRNPLRNGLQYLELSRRQEDA
eukprot:Unigene14306_Nuclearia_a/m.43153 Unigene14306_Nuclearia_a/g.43153  ORF Unigene14306_Nuclearia_a/g.43153 Unigene14306_Nuclearia_a/m.43153 type:complete len:192 (-) Unigene14306_Nuclearia_a:74-649(-)